MTDMSYVLAHCVDILRQQLTCRVDTGLLAQIWWDKKSPKAFPDFSNHHTCDNFEEVRRWAQSHQAPEVVPDGFLKKPDPGDAFEEIP